MIIKREFDGAYLTCDKEVEISPIPMPIYVFIVLLDIVAQQGRPHFHGRVKLDNYTLQLLMAAHTTALSQTKEELPQVGFPYPHAYIFIVLLDMVAQQVGILSLMLLSHAGVDRRYYFWTIKHTSKSLLALLQHSKY